MSVKVDLHSHSIASPDGGITPQQYHEILRQNVLDCVAITDHNRVDLAIALHKELGDSVIVGEEITTSGGEIIGLYLTKAIPPNRSPLSTVQAIKAQGGIVYIPHPFETIRHGITKSTLDEIIDHVDIIEAHNGRAFFQNKGPEAAAWATLHHRVRASSSDAHGLKGLGSSYTELEELPNKDTLMALMEKARLTTKSPPLHTLLYPKFYRLSKALKSPRRN
jgi:predicted metal-dependent phosphoesterase TrpH